MHFKTRFSCLKTEIGTTIFNVGVYSYYYHYYYYYYYYLLQLSFHSVAVFLTLVKKRINIYKRNNTKTQYKTKQNTVNTSTNITKTHTQ